jgi:hypothetical protein
MLGGMPPPPCIWEDRDTMENSVVVVAVVWERRHS